MMIYVIVIFVIARQMGAFKTVTIVAPKMNNIKLNKV